MQYSKVGLTATARLLGKVQGVVVQTNNLTDGSESKGKLT